MSKSFIFNLAIVIMLAWGELSLHEKQRESAELKLKAPPKVDRAVVAGSSLELSVWRIHLQRESIDLASSPGPLGALGPLEGAPEANRRKRQPRPRLGR